MSRRLKGEQLRAQKLEINSRNLGKELPNELDQSPLPGYVTRPLGNMLLPSGNRLLCPETQPSASQPQAASEQEQTQLPSGERDPSPMPGYAVVISAAEIKTRKPLSEI